MRRIIITHVGTSTLECAVLKQRSPPPDYQTELKRIQANMPQSDATFKKWSAHLEDGARKAWNANPDTAASRKEVPAEIASLSLLNPQPGERIVLVCSDTIVGHFCGKLLREILISPHAMGFYALGLDVPPVERLPGVEVKDGDQFIQAGLPAYMRLVARLRKQMEDQGSFQFDQLVFNITGGYKGMLPFATLAAQLLGTHPHHNVATELIYAHEEEQSLITLSPILPIDWQHLEDLFPRISTLVKYAGSTRAQALDRDVELAPYREMSASGQPNALAKAVFYLLNDLGWI